METTEKTLFDILEAEFPHAFVFFFNFFKKQNNGHCKPKKVLNHENETSKIIIKAYALESVKLILTDDSFSSSEELEKTLRRVFHYHEAILAPKTKKEPVATETVAENTTNSPVINPERVAYYEKLLAGRSISPDMMHVVVTFEFSPENRKRTMPWEKAA